RDAAGGGARRALDELARAERGGAAGGGRRGALRARARRGGLPGGDARAGGVVRAPGVGVPRYADGGVGAGAAAGLDRVRAGVLQAGGARPPPALGPLMPASLRGGATEQAVTVRFTERP